MRTSGVLLFGLIVLGGCQNSEQASKGESEKQENATASLQESISSNGGVKTESRIDNEEPGELDDSNLPEGEDIFETNSELSDTCFEDLNVAHNPATEKPFTVGEILNRIESNANVSNFRVDNTATGYVVRFSLIDPLTERSSSYSYELTSPEAFSIACKGKNGLFFGDAAADGQRMTSNETVAVLTKLDIYNR